MRTNKNLLIFAAASAVCIIAWFATSIKGGERTYEVRPEISIPEYRTDAARAIDAYERLMERYMDLTGYNFTNISSDIRIVVRRLDAIDGKLENLSTRIAGIEKALGIKQSEPAPEEKTRTKAAKEQLSPLN